MVLMIWIFLWKDDIVVETYESVKEGEDKRIEGVMTSPDLAYGSLEESLEHLSFI